MNLEILNECKSSNDWPTGGRYISVLAILMSKEKDSLACLFDLSLLVFCSMVTHWFSFLPASKQSLGVFSYITELRSIHQEQFLKGEKVTDIQKWCLRNTYFESGERTEMNCLISKLRVSPLFESVIAITDFPVCVFTESAPLLLSSECLGNLPLLSQFFFLCNRVPVFILYIFVPRTSTKPWETRWLSIYIMFSQFINIGPLNFTPAKWGRGVCLGLFILNIEKAFGELLSSSESHWLPPVSFCDGKYWFSVPLSFLQRRYARCKIM